MAGTTNSVFILAKLYMNLWSRFNWFKPAFVNTGMKLRVQEKQGKFYHLSNS
jgi:hypothetical protein